MERKMKNVMFTGSAKVYSVAIYPERMVVEGKMTASSKDGQYVLEYAKEDLMEWGEMMENSGFDSSKLSEEDLAFQNYLYELCPESYMSYVHMGTKLADRQGIGKFVIGSNEIICLYDSDRANHHDGSEITFLIQTTKHDDFTICITLAKNVIDMSLGEGDNHNEK